MPASSQGGAEELRVQARDSPGLVGPGPKQAHVLGIDWRRSGHKALGSDLPSCGLASGARK